MRAVWKEAMVDSDHVPDESFRVGEETHSRSVSKNNSHVRSSPKVDKKKVQS